MLTGSENAPDLCADVDPVALTHESKKAEFTLGPYSSKWHSLHLGSHSGWSREATCCRGSEAGPVKRDVGRDCKLSSSYLLASGEASMTASENTIV